MTGPSGDAAVVRASDEEIAGLERLGWPQMPDWPATAWATYLEPGIDRGQHAAVFLCVTAEGEVLGWAAGTELLGVAELEYILVHPDHRGQGLAKRLLEVWLEWAAAHGAERAHIEVRAGNIAAQRLYLSCGFTELGRRRNYYREPVEDALSLQRGLCGKALEAAEASVDGNRNGILIPWFVTAFCMGSRCW